MRVLSGDHDGIQSMAGLLLRLRWSEPLASITYISQLPSLSETKAILLLGGGVGVGVGVAPGISPPPQAERRSKVVTSNERKHIVRCLIIIQIHPVICYYPSKSIGNCQKQSG